MESEYNIGIFNRIPRGFFPTPKGEEFLAHAQSLLNSVNRLEELYKFSPEDEEQWGITFPVSFYIAQAFVSFAKEVTGNPKIKIDYLEADSITAINHVVCYDNNLGIICYQENDEDFFLSFLKGKGLTTKPLNLPV